MVTIQRRCLIFKVMPVILLCSLNSRLSLQSCIRLESSLNTTDVCYPLQTSASNCVEAADVHNKICRSNIFSCHCSYRHCFCFCSQKRAKIHDSEYESYSHPWCNIYTHYYIIKYMQHIIINAVIPNSHTCKASI